VVHGLLKNQINWSTFGCHLNSIARQFGKLKEKLLISVDNLLEGDPLITFWRALQSTIQDFLDPCIMLCIVFISYAKPTKTNNLRKGNHMVHRHLF
jgi:hypothetical protein